MGVSSDLDLSFHYAPACSMSGCDRPPVVKVASFWSYGPLREFKCYGLACEEHRESLLSLAQIRRNKLAVGDDEQVGPVEAILLRYTGADSAVGRGDSI